MTYYLDQLIKYFPQVAGYAIIIALTAFVVWKLTTFYTRTKDTSKKVDGMESKLANIEGILQKISAGLSTLSSVLVEKNVISQSCYSHENSPRVINDLGKKMYQESGAAELFERIKSSLLSDLERKTFDSLLELERSCLDVLLEKMNDPMFKTIQNFAYQHPTFEKIPLTYTDILFVMSLMLREEYKKIHPEKNLALE